jgi:hypothetical protein
MTATQHHSKPVTQWRRVVRTFEDWNKRLAAI